MAADLRGFKYALEPLRQMRQWRLDKASADLARARARLQESREAHEGLVRETELQASLARHAWQRLADAAAHAHRLAFLAGLQRAVAQKAREIRVHETDLEAAQARWRECQQEVDMLDRHRKHERNAYRADHDHKTGALADQDWLARTAAKRGAAP